VIGALWTRGSRRYDFPRRRRVRGQALVEFALVAPIFFLAIFAIIEFGWYVYQVQTLNEAAREGARYAIVHGSTSLCPSGPMPGTPTVTNWCDPSGAKIETTVRSFATGIAPAAISFPTMTWSPNNGRGSIFTLVVQATHQWLVPLIPLPPITIEGASSLVVQH
jgi:hypothetical protein